MNASQTAKGTWNTRPMRKPLYRAVMVRLGFCRCGEAWGKMKTFYDLFCRECG